MLLTFRLPAALSLAASLFLAACAGEPVTPTASPEDLAHYAEREDGGFVIPAVDPGYLQYANARATVPYTGTEEPGTIVVDPFARKLYYVTGPGEAVRYGIAVGREGKGFRGDATISRRAEWPFWQPTANMIRTEPEKYEQYAAGMQGGLDNPLGARALYLYRGGADTKYRIHGTSNASTIGHKTSAGCIRLFNQDIIDLYERVPNGTKVHVRSEAESLAMEGPYVELPNGYAVPEAIAADALKEYERAMKRKARQEGTALVASN